MKTETEDQLLGSVQREKWKWLLDRGAQGDGVTIYFTMPSGVKGTVDTFGRCTWEDTDVKPEERKKP